MSKKPYVIVTAPTMEILELLVEGHLAEGLVPTGSVTVDRLDTTMYLQAMYLPPPPSIQHVVEESQPRRRIEKL